MKFRRVLLPMLLALTLLCAPAARGETLPYAKVYEPETSCALPATVGWLADAAALDAARADARPATAFVWLDEALRVLSRDGAVISEKIDDYVAATSGAVIPAFYVSDAPTARALKAYLTQSGLGDCFVAAAPENAALVKDVADLPHVRGLLDYSGITEASRDTLVNMVAAVNGAHGKVLLLSESAATKENVRFLQSLCATVWVRVQDTLKSVVAQYANGVNGVVAQDYALALRALSLFKDDAPTLLRVPMIVGHRGMPSMFVENTLYSALGAYAAGAESIENDIQISSDGTIFILHDDSPARLLGVKNVAMAESMTIDELRAISFLWDDPDAGVLAKNNQPAARSRYGTIIGTPHMNRIPTLEEFIVAFKGADVTHDTEIKSYNPAIVRAYKELVDRYDAWDQFFTITFNTVILKEVYRNFPEISIGALGMEGYDQFPSMPAFKKYDEIAQSEGAEAALLQLYAVIDQWNATYNPYLRFSYDVASAGRHRGLTVWPWTYNDAASFADAYMKGIYGLTTNYAWWATDYVVDIRAQDVTAASPEDIPLPVAETRAGAVFTLEDAELVTLDGSLEAGEALLIWRYQADMTVDGERFGTYYLYSNPFTAAAAQ